MTSVSDAAVAGLAGKDNNGCCTSWDISESTTVWTRPPLHPASESNPGLPHVAKGRDSHRDPNGCT